MKMPTTMMCALSVALFAGLGSAQSTWHVDELALAPFDGTPSHPFVNIQQAVDDPDTLAGDTLLVAPGTYPAFATIKRLTIRSTDGPLVTAISSDSAPSTPGWGPITASLMGWHSAFEGFTVWGPPAGIAVRGNDLDMRRCILLGLKVAESGFLDCDDGFARNCLISGFKFGLASVAYCNANARNSILRANTFDVAGTAAYCVYSSEWIGSGGAFWSLQTDPQVFDFAGHDFHLMPGSPCIDAGDPTSPLDPDGTRADIGPFAFDPNYQPYTIFCTAKVNSLGCTPSIQAVNTASVSSPRPFWIACTNQISQRSGLMSYGFAPLALPYQGGYKCVASPTRRSGLLTSGGNAGSPDCSGEFAVNFNDVIQAGVDPALTLGQDVFCQFWARDPGSSFSSNRSDALRFRIAP